MNRISKYITASSFDYNTIKGPTSSLQSNILFKQVLQEEEWAYLHNMDFAYCSLTWMFDFHCEEWRTHCVCRWLVSKCICWKWEKFLWVKIWKNPVSDTVFCLLYIYLFYSNSHSTATYLISQTWISRIAIPPNIRRKETATLNPVLCKNNSVYSLVWNIQIDSIHKMTTGRI